MRSSLLNGNMVGHQHPSITGGGGFYQKAVEAFDEIAAIRIITEDFAPFDTAHDDVVQRTRSVPK